MHNDFFGESALRIPRAWGETTPSRNKHACLRSSESRKRTAMKKSNIRTEILVLSRIPLSAREQPLKTLKI